MFGHVLQLTQGICNQQHIVREPHICEMAFVALTQLHPQPFDNERGFTSEIVF